jgi:hypothetical protein
MLIFRQSTADQTSGTQIAFRWEVPEAHKKTVEDALTYDGTLEEPKEVKGVLVVFVGLVLIPYLVQAVIKLQRQIQYGGIVIDTRKKPLDIHVDKRLPSGLIVVVQPDGKVQFERDEVEGPDKIIASIMQGIGGK